MNALDIVHLTPEGHAKLTAELEYLTDVRRPEVARMIREIFLQQNAYDAVDTFCPMSKQYDMMKAIKFYADLARTAQAGGATPQQVIGVKSKNELVQIKFIKDYEPVLANIRKDMEAEFDAVRAA